jgi:hypothetical protein
MFQYFCPNIEAFCLKLNPTEHLQRHNIMIQTFNLKA